MELFWKKLNSSNTSGKFKENDVFLKKKGLRASFSLIKSLGNIKTSSLIKIFEKVVEPILLYNSEITQAFLPNTLSYTDFQKNIWKNENQINTVTNSFLRKILGVGKKHQLGVFLQKQVNIQLY